MHTPGQPCEFCGDVGAETFLHARCHISAPLQASIIGDELILRCYLPECNREVARLKIKERIAGMVVKHGV